MPYVDWQNKDLETSRYAIQKVEWYGVRRSCNFAQCVTRRSAARDTPQLWSWVETLRGRGLTLMHVSVPTSRGGEAETMGGLEESDGFRVALGP